MWSKENTDLAYTVEIENAYLYSDITGGYLGTYRQAALNAIETLPISDIKAKYGTDSIGYIFLLPGSGRGYAYTCDSNVPDSKNEFITLYTDSNAIARTHEMLHLFGAMDLYFIDLDGYKNTYSNIYSYIESTYKNPPEIMNNVDVMNGDGGSITQTVSDITLAMIGLIDTESVSVKFPEIDFPDEPGVSVQSY